MKTLACLLSGFVILLLVGCSGIGPQTVARDRFDYTTALSDSWKSQMLLNMVKLRYGDAPVFLDVASVINQYAWEGQVNFGLFWARDPGFNTQNLGGAGRYTDRPTITYNPLTGEKFARSLMTPIPPPAILSLIQAGYPVDLVIRMCVNAINGIRNRYGGIARARAADPEFYPLLERMRRLQDSGAVGLRVQKTNDKEGVVMAFQGKVDESLEADRAAVRRTLGLNPTAQEFRFVYGAIAENDQEIAILSRSILEVLIDLASLIEVPAVHVEEKRVNPTRLEENVPGAPTAPLIRITSWPTRPADAFVSVPYRDYWFWIDDRDLRSKAIFSFLMFVFALTETGGKEGVPIVTIPAG